MNTQDASEQLDRVLSFFGRAEAKASFLFAINVGMLAIALSNLSYSDIKTWFIVLPLFGAFFCSASAIFFVGSVVRPDTFGGKSSLIYFGSISKLSASEYQKKCKAATPEDIRDDILSQVHRNSEILVTKFEDVSKSLFWTTISTIPWALFLGISSVYHSQIVSVGSR